MHSPRSSLLPGTATHSEHEATHILHQIGSNETSLKDALQQLLWPRGRTGTLQGSQQLGTLIRAGTWCHRAMRRTSGSTPYQPAPASPNPFFWLALIFKQMCTGTVVRQAKPTRSLPSSQKMSVLRATPEPWDLGQGSSSADFCPRWTGPAPGPFPTCSAISYWWELSCCVQPGQPVPGLAAARKCSAEFQGPFLDWLC